MLTNRELASLILISLLVILSVGIPQWRRVVGPPSVGVLRAFATPKIIGVFIVFFIWEALCVCLGWLLGGWGPELLKDTLIIVFTVGAVMVFRTANAKSGTVIARIVIVETVGLTALVSFYLNLASFPLWLELLTQPLFTAAVLLNAFSATKPEWRPAHQFLSVLLALGFLGALAGTTVNLVQTWGALDFIAIFREFLLSIWLPLLLLPFLYAAAFYAGAEALLVRLAWLRSKTRRLPVRITLAVLLGLHGSVDLTSRLDGRYNSVGMASTFREARDGMRKFRADLRRRETEERVRLASLESDAGKSGTDEDGAQLDRREFDGTKRQLDWISTTQMGRYEGNGQRYWDDLTDVMVDAKKYGLPAEHGVHVQMAKDGQRWRGWRVLPSGWVLGLGASGPQSEWYYSGPTPPATWPGDAGSPWVDGMTDPDLPPDWAKDDGTRL